MPAQVQSKARTTVRQDDRRGPPEKMPRRPRRAQQQAQPRRSAAGMRMGVDVAAQSWGGREPKRRRRAATLGRPGREPVALASRGVAGVAARSGSQKSRVPTMP